MSTEKIRDCYKIDDDGQAMECIKTVIRQSQDTCKPRLVLLVREGCEGCQEEKVHYKGDIESGLVSSIDILSPEGKQIALRNKIDAVPALLILDCQGNAIE
jgi:hypothetical protein